MKKHNNMRCRPVALFVALITTGLLGNDSMAQSEAQTENTRELEEIIVTGKKSSLVNSLNTKRSARSVLDGITAEELGLFPDANVADSLSRISGVTIDRTRGGEGKGVNIRGLGAQYSIVTMNGRLMATDSEGREFAFDVLPSEVISSAWVHKSVTASALEGSIGGAIDLVTAKPLDNPGLNVSGSLEGSYGDKVDDVGHKLSGVWSNSFNNDTFGVLFTALHSSTPIRNDELTDLNYAENWSWDHDNDTGWVNWQDSSNQLRIPSTFAYGAFLEERERIALSSAFQYRPNDRVDITFDALYTRLDAPATAYTASYYTVGAADRWQNAQYSGPATDLNPQGTFVTGYDIPDFVPELVTETEFRVVDTYQVGLNGKFQVTDSLSVTGDVYASSATRDAGGKDFFIASHSVGAVPNLTTFSLNSEGLPNVSIDFSDNPNISSVADLVGDEHFGPHYSEAKGVDVEDDVKGASLDGKWDLGYADNRFGFINGDISFNFGANISERTKSRIQFDNQHARELYSGAPFTFADTGVNVVKPLQLDGLLSQVSGDFPNIFVGFDPQAYQQALAMADNNPNVINPNTGLPYPEGYSDSDEPRFNGNASFAVEEQTNSAYVQFNIESDNWWANLGLRQVHTKTNSRGWTQPITQIRALSSGYVADYGVLTPISESNSYSELLPSINFGYQFTENLLMRVSAAEVMSRASMNQLSTQVEDESITWGGWYLHNVGNPSLAPVVGQQADITLEWYYSDDSALTAGVFSKDMEGFIQDWLPRYANTEENGYQNPDRPVYLIQDRDDNGAPIPGSFSEQVFDVFEPQNLDSATALGLEIGLQHFFDNGFGINANFTTIDTESVVSETVAGVLPGVADRFYSISLIYETEKLGMQLSAYHTDGYVDSNWSPLNQAGETTYKSTVKGFTDVSFSASYQFRENTSVYLELSNLLNESWHAFAGRTDIPSSYAEWGRKANFGVRFNF